MTPSFETRRHKYFLSVLRRGNHSELDNHELHQSPDSLSLYDSRHHLYPLTYASKHKQSFDFLKFPKK